MYLNKNNEEIKILALREIRTWGISVWLCLCVFFALLVSRENKSWTPFLGGTLALLCVLSVLGLLALFYWTNNETIHDHQGQIDGLKREVEFLRKLLIEGASTNYEDERAERNIREILTDPIDEDYPNDEGEKTRPMVIDAKYSEAIKNGTYHAKNKTEGLRIYGVWLKKGKRNRSTKSPIKSHHSRQKASSSSVSAASSLKKGFRRNKNSQSSKPRQLRRANKPITKMSRVDKSPMSKDKLIGMKAVHFIGQNPVDPRDFQEGPKIKNVDGLFKKWHLSGWSSRMREVSNAFPVKNGTVQIYKNQDPLFLCTTMTNTPTKSTKTNTCYTGGLVYLDQGDSVFIRDLEPGRFSVLLPSHSFFGFVQVSQIGI
ncbi:unnamed protein product [Lepeophtheirus salmonis]|uniref:(salmon louse) hypothetical protein n=1 Tax=Lepeophtheirus salmonis TaxID=72036 RepID=A0A7R8CJV0_LEPSM|nr:unnamed protein product [Lepeophtheirus salmonis]CAF2841632.1 unnamed protein product [Lepeophtheirus salmonis]